MLAWRLGSTAEGRLLSGVRATVGLWSWFGSVCLVIGRLFLVAGIDGSGCSWTVAKGWLWSGIVVCLAILRWPAMCFSTIALWLSISTPPLSLIPPSLPIVAVPISPLKKYPSYQSIPSTRQPYHFPFTPIPLSSQSPHPSSLFPHLSPSPPPISSL